MSEELKLIFVHTIQDFGGGSRQLRALNRIDVNDHDVGAAAVVDQGKQDRVTHVATVPKVLSLDLKGLEHVRQASGGKDAVNADFFVLEDLDLTGPYIGCR